MKTELKKFIKLFIHANVHHRRIIDKRISKTGVYRSQHMLLMYLSKHELISQREIADAFEISPASVAVSLKKLEKDGYINKVADKDDSRLKKVNITQKGLYVIEESHKIFDAVDNEVFSGFTMEEIITMTGFMERLCSNMTDIEKEMNGDD